MTLTHSCGHKVHYDMRADDEVDVVELVKGLKDMERQPCPACKRPKAGK